MVGRAVAYDTTDPQFKSRHQQTFFYQLYNRKDKNKEKEARNGPSLKKSEELWVEGGLIVAMVALVVNSGY